MNPVGKSAAKESRTGSLSAYLPSFACLTVDRKQFRTAAFSFFAYFSAFARRLQALYSSINFNTLQSGETNS